MIRLIAFDLDGTLVDSRQDLAEAVNHLITELGGHNLPEEAVVAMVGEGAPLLVARALSAAALDPRTPGALDRFLELYDEGLLRNTLPYAGVREVLDALRGRVPLAVLTNKPARATARVLEGLDLLHVFDQVLGGDTPLGRKPHPQGLLTLMAHAQSTPGSTLFVGDSAVDLQTARSAGCRICLARYGFGYRFDASDFRGDELFIDTPAELTGLVMSLRA